MSGLRKVTDSEKFLSDLARLFQSHRMYPAGNVYVESAAKRACHSLESRGEQIRVTNMGDSLLIDDKVVTVISSPLERLLDAFAEVRWESLRFDPALGTEGLLDILERVRSKEAGPYRRQGFAAGSLNMDDEEDERLKMAMEGAGYLSLAPMVQEMIFDVKNAKKGAWIRAHDVVKMLSEHLVSGDELFGAISELKDFDEYTFTHALNVSMLSLAMARGIQAPDNIVDHISMGALCHDLGKEKVPEEILNKRGKLDADERAVMDRHPVEGSAKILSAPGDTPPLVPVIAFEHHMRADCSGYPKLPVKYRPHPASLLVAVADTYDAIRTVRPYQTNPFTPAGAASILIAEANKGRLHRVFTSMMIKMVDVLKPGSWVVLDDDRRGQVIANGEYDVLEPLIETEGMEILDLSMPDSPSVVKIEDDKPEGEGVASE